MLHNMIRKKVFLKISNEIKNTMRHHGLKAVVCDRRSCFGCSESNRALKGAVFFRLSDIRNIFVSSKNEDI